jgi:hypothetical protein
MAGAFIPAEEMIKALTALTGIPAYKYHAFELLVMLDLDVYQATRRLIVPADPEFSKLHRVLQSVYCRKNCSMPAVSTAAPNSASRCAL